MGFFKSFKDTVLTYSWWLILALRCCFARRASGKLPDGQIALFVWKFPPDISGGVYRPLSFVRYWNKMGSRISVFSGPIRTPSSAGLSLLEKLPTDINQYRVNNTSLPTPSYKFTPRINGGFVNGLSLAILAIREMTNNPPSVIVASGPTFQSFMAAFFVSRYFSAKLILDYRDEWTECPFAFVDKGNVDRKWELKCLKAADSVVFTTLSQLKNNRNVFNAGHEWKYHVVPNGWEPEDFEKINLSKELEDVGEILLSFFGALEDHTPPEKFLKQIEKVFLRRKDLKSRIKLQFVGTKSEKCSEQLSNFIFSENIVVGGQVAKSEVGKLMCKSAALLIFYSDCFKRYIPGKFYDYLASGRPIICFGNEGEVPGILRELKTGFLVPEGDDYILEKTLDRLIDKPLSINDEKVENWLKTYTRENMAKKFYKIIADLN